MGDLKQNIRRYVTDAGACRVGFAVAAPVDDCEDKLYSAWLKAGCHGEMGYLDRYDDIRRDPRLLLDGAQTVISCAFDYRQSCRHQLFADYALGEDYHDVIRRRLSVAAEKICKLYGGVTRICVDTAPIHERYWAAKAGIGVIGLNGQLIVDGIGSKVFIAEIIWTGAVEPDASREDESCLQCGACVKACPGQALDGCGRLDARRCNSYLTIEFRGVLPEGLRLDRRIYGCDICQDVCPLCVEGSTEIEEFLPSDGLMELDLDAIVDMDSDGFRQLFRKSAVRRAKLFGLQRNAIRSKKRL